MSTETSLFLEAHEIVELKDHIYRRKTEAAPPVKKRSWDT